MNMNTYIHRLSNPQAYLWYIVYSPFTSDEATFFVWIEWSRNPHIPYQYYFEVCMETTRAHSTQLVEPWNYSNKTKLVWELRFKNQSVVSF